MKPSLGGTASSSLPPLGRTRHGVTEQGIAKLDKMSVNENMKQVNSEAAILAKSLLEVDEVGALPIPKSCKHYARMKSSILFKDKGLAKPRLFIKQSADVSNQSDKKNGFKNYDGSAYTGKKKKTVAEGGVKDFLLKHGIARTREIKVGRDSNDDAYLAIPVFDNPTPGNWTNLFNLNQAGPSPKQKFKERLVFLVRNRRGYRPGDVFVSELGRFLVTDVLGIKEI